MGERQIAKGDRVRYRDAFDTWREGVAQSDVEGTHAVRDGRYRKIHDFPIVWINGVPWPVEDVELIDQ